MRVSPVALLYRERSLEEALTFSDRVTQITHDHSEGRKGARAVTEAIWLALQRMGAGVVRRKIARRYGYDRERSVDATFASTRSYLARQISLARSRIASIWSGSVANGSG